MSLDQSRVFARLFSLVRVIYPGGIIVRISGGSAKGIELKTKKAKGLRPTTTLVRGAIFNCLSSFNFNDAHALDLFAGLGTLGLEALSRGAGHVDFVEGSSALCKIIRSNLLLLKMPEKGTVYNYRIGQSYSHKELTYDIIFADPPYEIVIRRKMLEALAKVINPGGALVIEQSRRQTAEPGCCDLEMVYNRDYGDSKLIIYNKVI